MKNRLYKLWMLFYSCVLCVIIIATCSITAFATETNESTTPKNTKTTPTDSGNCGENVTWEYYAEEAILIITGSGEMNTYSYGYAPWYKYAASIKKVEVGEEITLISNGAFYGFELLEEITIPFVGKTRDYSTSKEQLFGYIFGTRQFNNSELTEQCFTDSLSRKTGTYANLANTPGNLTGHYTSISLYPFFEYTYGYTTFWQSRDTSYDKYQMDIVFRETGKVREKNPQTNTWQYFYSGYIYSTSGKPASGYTVDYYLPTSLTTV